MPKARKRRPALYLRFWRKTEDFVSGSPLTGKLRSIWHKLGPGVITGASDDDPSGIVIYSIAGARTGLTFLWTALLTIPLMAGIQQTCAKIAIVGHRGLAEAMQKVISRRVAIAVGVLMFLANTLNVAADLRAIGDTLALLLPLPTEFWIIVAGLVILFATVFLSYRRFTEVLKVLALSLFAYILAALFLKLDWSSVLRATLLPHFPKSRDEFLILAAILGTTISPYLFFWQADEEVEELSAQPKPKKVGREIKRMRADTIIGMTLSNVVMFFVILTGANLAIAGGAPPETIGDIARGLEPLAGNFATFLFALATIGTGLIAIPILAGGAAYVLSEIFRFPASLNKRVAEAKYFYLALFSSILIGTLLALFPIDSLDLLFTTGVIYALLTPILIILILVIANDKKIMGKYKNSLLENALGVLTLILMALVAVLSFI